jgi:peptide/nickel transport system substrate-binding protein
MQWFAAQQTNMRWTVLRRCATSLMLAALALPCAARTRPHYGGTLRVEIEGDPWGDSRNGPDGLARRLVLDGLTVLDAKGNVQPALSTEWESSDNDHRWQFRLRAGVRFQDGASLTSNSVVSALNLACPQNCPWNAVRPAGSLVIFTTDSPSPHLPALLARGEFLIAETATPEAGRPSGPNGIVGTGPFAVKGFTNGALSLVANDTCWQGRPFVDAINLQVHRSIRDQWLDLSVGRADVVEVPAEMLREARQQQLTLAVSPPLTELALAVADNGALANSQLRGAIAEAVDRGALFNVIFQKQGEIAASLLPQALTGYAFLFPTERDLNRAHELRGGLSSPPLTLSYDGNGAMQLAAQRIAINLREAGFTVQVAAGAQHTDLALRTLSIAGAEPAAVMENLLRSAGQYAPMTQQTPEALFTAEREFLNLDTLIPLIDLPRAYACAGRVRDLALRADGTPDLANASLQDSSGDAP